MKNLVLVSFLIFSQLSYAYESDQHSVPEMELAEMGEDFSIFIHGKIEKAITVINLDIKELPRKIELMEQELESPEITKSKSKLKKLLKKIDEARTRLAFIKTNEGIVSSVYEELGMTFTWEDQLDGVFGRPLSIFPYPKNIKDDLQITYLARKTKNIYTLSGFLRAMPSSYFVFCSSLKIFGVYLGVDKLGHMMNQGFEYYDLYHKELAKGKSASEAMEITIESGRATENGMFGMIVNGVYSNADLAANFAGYQFYENLLNPIEDGDSTHSPILKVKDDFTVEFNEVDNTKFMKPFFADHLNEALNPSHYEKIQRSTIRSAIKKRCEGVMKFYGIKSKEEAKAYTDSLSTWFNQDYGHRNDDLIRIDDVCFEEL